MLIDSSIAGASGDKILSAFVDAGGTSLREAIDEVTEQVRQKYRKRKGVIEDDKVGAFKEY